MVEHTRTLGFWVAFALGLGTMIAAGIFSLSGQAVAVVGSSAIVSFVIAALIAGVTAWSYSEFASIYAENGGGYLFSSRTASHRAGECGRTGAAPGPVDPSANRCYSRPARSRSTRSPY